MATLSHQHNRAIQDLINNTPNFFIQINLGKFLAKYFVCHILAEKLIEYRESDVAKKRKKKKKKTEDKKEETKKFNISSIKSAIKYFGLEIGDDTIDEIFTTQNRRKGNYSCRILRNKYVHTLSTNSCNEIETRFNDLDSYMNEWISLFE